MLVSLILLFALSGIYLYYFPGIPGLQKEPYTYALLLGCPSHDDGTYSSSQIKRCDLAIEAYQKHLYTTLIITGGAVKNQYKESHEMAKYIQKKENIPIILEDHSQNTFENFTFSKEIIQNDSVLILSSGTHIRRACAIGRQFFSNYSGYWYPDHKPKHILRECISRIIYIRIEIQKAYKK